MADPSTWRRSRRRWPRWTRGVARLELARSLVELGAARRRARGAAPRGSRSSGYGARAPLRRGGAGRARGHGAARDRRATAAPRAHGPDALTPSERRVAELAAGGRTNREIAAELYVTLATVQTHLRHVFQKLGVHARTELRDALEEKITHAH